MSTNHFCATFCRRSSECYSFIQIDCDKKKTNKLTSWNGWYLIVFSSSSSSATFSDNFNLILDKCNWQIEMSSRQCAALTSKTDTKIWFWFNICARANAVFCSVIQVDFVHVSSARQIANVFCSNAFYLDRRPPKMKLKTIDSDEKTFQLSFQFVVVAHCHITVVAVELKFVKNFDNFLIEKKPKLMSACIASIIMWNKNANADSNSYLRATQSSSRALTHIPH